MSRVASNVDNGVSFLAHMCQIILLCTVHGCALCILFSIPTSEIRLITIQILVYVAGCDCDDLFVSCFNTLGRPWFFVLECVVDRRLPDIIGHTGPQSGDMALLADLETLIW